MSELTQKLNQLPIGRWKTVFSSNIGRLGNISRGFQSDEALVAQILRSKDPSLYGLIITRYRHKLTALARTTLAGTAASSDVDDVVQDAFVSAYDHLKSFRSDATFRPWLYKIAMNRCQDRLRASRWTTDKEIEETQSDGGRGPLKTVLDNDQARRISDAVENLPPTQRVLFLLRHMENLSYAELSEVTGLPEGTVKVNLFRARTRVRELVKDEEV